MVIRVLAAVLLPLLLIAGLIFGSLTAFLGAQPAGNPGTNSCAATGYTTGAIRIPMTAGYSITSRFGARIDPIRGGSTFHTGLDLSHTGGPAAIVAMMNGTVRHAGPWGDGGNTVIVEHAQGITSYYEHLASVSVSRGDTVVAGQQIGIEGSSGHSTGRHLHWRIEVNGDLVDPEVWAPAHNIRLDGTAPPVGTQGSGASVSSSTTIVAGYRGDQLANAAAIIKAGQALNLDTWTITVGVMTAMGESDLVILDHGDIAGPDSRGLFQQRDNGAWGSYADRMNPTISATNFFKALIQVPGYRDLSPTMAAHRTQRNYDPNHYTRWWHSAVEVVSHLLGDPTLLASLSGPTGRGCGPAGTGELPAYAANCPATGSPAEAGLQPVTLAALRCTKQAFGWIITMYGLGDRAGVSEHPAGLAVDYMIDDWNTQAGNARGWQVAQWTKAHAAELGVDYVIYDKLIWSVARDSEGWRPYMRYSPDAGPTLLHQDHVHVSYQTR